MKLSEAIQEGAKIRPQEYGRYYSPQGYPCTGSCALGAAHEAATGNISQTMYARMITQALLQSFPCLNEAVEHPITGKTYGLDEVIVHLNDKAQWTREQIAEWLEGLGY